MFEFQFLLSRAMDDLMALKLVIQVNFIINFKFGKGFLESYKDGSRHHYLYVKIRSAVAINCKTYEVRDTRHGGAGWRGK